ncbi:MULTISPECIES: hypothetical protein [unclassified Streptomyces]|uniref:hypothetical protein n=1 Tax=unclassified Streptomyces TaxID=2593676 RepID=UPI003804D0FC
MTNTRFGHRSSRPLRWPVLSLLCLGVLAVLLRRRSAAPRTATPPRDRAARRTGPRHTASDDIAAHLTTSW